MRTALPSFAAVLSAALVAPLRPVVAQESPAAPASSAAVRAVPRLLDSARAALDAGQVEPAVRMAERYTSHNVRDARGYVTLGDAYFRRMPAGRFQALRAYEEAIRLAPDDPEPAYLYAQVGIYLGGDDGEAIARRGLEHTLELDPLFRNAWTQWLLVFRNSSSRRRMRERLSIYDSVPEVRARIAYLFLEDEMYRQADSVLDGLLALDSTNVEWLAWRAQSAFEAGDSDTGGRLYARALLNAAHDSTEALWRQAVGVANPDELRAWDRLPAARRGAWLAAFWARRDPDLFDNANRRLAEHFTRLRYARRMYPLLHPLVSYHRSQIARAMNLEPARGERDFYTQCEMYEVLVPNSRLGFRPVIGDSAEAVNGAMGAFEWERAMAAGVPTGVSRASDRARMSPSAFNTTADGDAGVGASYFDRTIYVPLNMDLRSVDTTAARVGYNLATGLDDRGVLYLRFGTPRTVALGGRNDANPQCTTRDVERWYYDDLGEIRFARPSAFSRGERTVSEMVFRAMNGQQFEGVREAIAHDEPDEKAPMEFGVWTAQFAGGRPGSVETMVVSTRGALAAALVSEAFGEGTVRRSAAGAVILESDPGRYVLLAHARDSSQLGRQQLGVETRRFWPLPSMSDMVLAPAWAAANVSRYDMLRHVARTLTFREGTTMRVYAEVYGLVPDGPNVRYHAEYSLLRTDNQARDAARDAWPTATTLAFDRIQPNEPVGLTREVLDITPERLAPGRYVLRLAVRDQVSGKTAGRAQIAFVVRPGS